VEDEIGETHVDVYSKLNRKREFAVRIGVGGSSKRGSPWSCSGHAYVEVIEICQHRRVDVERNEHQKEQGQPVSVSVSVCVPHICGFVFTIIRDSSDT
jgi:hypothetical protein